MAKRLNISLSDRADELLQSLAQDCGMSVSQCLSQLVLRNHAQFRSLFALENTDSHTVTPIYTDLHTTTHKSTEPGTNLHPITPIESIPCSPVLEIDTKKELDFLALIANS